MGSDKPNGGSGAPNSQHEYQYSDATPPGNSPGPNPSPSAPMSVEQPKSQVAKNVGESAENGYSERVYRLEVWQHWFTAALVGTALLSGVIATWQGCEMKEQNKIMLRQMKQTDDVIKLSQLNQQAEIALESYSIENVVAEQSPVVKVKVKNVGHSTATIEHYGIEWVNRRRSGETITDLTAHLRNLHATSIKHQDWQLKRIGLISGEKFPIEQNRWEDLRKHDPKAIISVTHPAVIEYDKEVHQFAVYVFYKDAIRDTGFSQFILRYNPESKTFVPEENGTIIE
jgi:hypothetical protein